MCSTLLKKLRSPIFTPRSSQFDADVATPAGNSDRQSSTHRGWPLLQETASAPPDSGARDVGLLALQRLVAVLQLLGPRTRAAHDAHQRPQLLIDLVRTAGFRPLLLIFAQQSHMNFLKWNFAELAIERPQVLAEIGERARRDVTRAACRRHRA